MTYYRPPGLTADTQQIRRCNRRRGRPGWCWGSFAGALPACCFERLGGLRILPLVRHLASGEADSQFLIWKYADVTLQITFTGHSHGCTTPYIGAV
jgi:hypothetical protein